MANHKRNKLLVLAAALLTLLVVLISVAVFVSRQPDPSLSTEPSTEATTPSSEATEPPTQPPTEPPTEPPIVKESSFTLSATGDMLMHLPVINRYYTDGSYNFDGAFSHLRDYILKADYAVANLETTLSGGDYVHDDGSTGYKGYPQFNCPDAIVDGLKNAGFDALLTANNHTYDTRTVGLTRTQQIIAQRELDRLGTQADAEANDYLLVERNGISLGLMCYTYEDNADPNTKAPNGHTMSAADAPLICAFDYSNLPLFYSEVETYIAEMKASGADAIVMFIHWGSEYQTAHNTNQSAIAQKLCDLGVDVIIGGHPHVIQPVELLTSTVNADHKTVCLYSTGNALSNQRRQHMTLNTGHTEDGVLFSVTFTKYSDGTVILESAELLPLWVNDRHCILPIDKTVENWAAAFGVDNGVVAKMNESYDRTTAIVGAGMEQVKTYLTDHVAAVETRLNVQK